MTDPLLTNLSRAHRKVVRAQGSLRRAGEELRLAIVQAKSAGLTFREIAAAAGISRSRAEQIHKTAPTDTAAEPGQ